MAAPVPKESVGAETGADAKHASELLVLTERPSPAPFAGRWASQEDVRRFVRFLFVGGMNTLFGYLVFAVAWLFSRDQLLSVVVSTVVGALFNYFTIGKLVFVNRGFAALPVFLAGYALLLALNLGILELLGRAGVATLLAQLVATPALVVTSFAYNTLVTFRHPRK